MSYWLAPLGEGFRSVDEGMLFELCSRDWSTFLLVDRSVERGFSKLASRVWRTFVLTARGEGIFVLRIRFPTRLWGPPCCLLLEVRGFLGLGSAPICGGPLSD